MRMRCGRSIVSKATLRSRHGCEDLRLSSWQARSDSLTTQPLNEPRLGTRGRTLTAREQYWLGDLRQIESAGIGTKAYAERRDLSVHAVYQARKRLVRLGAWPERRAAAAPVFAPVRVLDAPGASAPACRLRFGGGAVLEWSTAPEPAVLAALLDRVGAAR